MEEHNFNDIRHLAPRPAPSMLAGSRGAMAYSASNSFPFNLRDILSILFKHKYKILALFFIFLLVSPVVHFVYPKLLPPLYEAKSVILFKSGRDYSGPELGTQKTPISFGKSDIFTSEILMLKSRDLKERLISTLRLDRLYPDIVRNPPPGINPQEFAILQMEKDLSVSEIRNSNFIEIKFTGKDPENTATVVNQLVDFYREKRRDVLSDPRSTFFLEKKLAEYRQKLKESEERLESFRREYGFYSFDKQMDFLLTQRAQLEATIKNATGEAEILKHSLATLKNQPKAEYEAVPSFSNGEEMTQEADTSGLGSKLMALQLKEQELLGKYTEKNLFVVNVRKEIEKVQELMKEQKTSASKPKQRSNGETYPVNFGDLGLEIHTNTIEANLKASEEKIVSYKTELGELDKQIQALGSQEKKLKELHRELEHNEGYYNTYSNKLEEVRITEDINRQEMASVTVLQPAVPPVKPINQSPGLMILMAAGAVVGLGAGVGLAFLLEILGQGLTTPENVENRLGIPVLATIALKR